MDDIRRLLRTTERITALTGAGISAESGIPTFRGPGGLWRNHKPEDLATAEAFERDPQLVWEWYRWRRKIIAKAEPNQGHYALVELEKRTSHFTLVTQNVDGLHERAGSQNVLRLHGSIWEERCSICGQPAVGLCLACRAMTRPGVVWFGEPLDPAVWDNAQKAAETAGVLLVIGTSAVVQPAASLVPLAKQSGATVVEINPDTTPVSPSVNFTVRGTAGDVLPRLLG